MLSGCVDANLLFVHLNCEKEEFQIKMLINQLTNEQKCIQRLTLCCEAIVLITKLPNQSDHVMFLDTGVHFYRGSLSPVPPRK